MSRPAPRSLIAVLVASQLAILGGAAPASAQSRSAPWGHGTHAFRLILNNLGFTPLKSLDQCEDRPKNKIIIVLGETGPLDRVPPSGIRRFVEKGGAVLIATDRPRMLTHKSVSNTWEDTFAVMVGGWPVEVTDSSGYRGLEECPILRQKDNSASPLFLDIQQGLATNRPTYLDIRQAPDGAVLAPMAHFPQGCVSWGANRPHRIFPKPHPQPKRITDDPSPLFAAGGSLDNGRVLVLADHSVFINDMMLQTDNDNIPFAYNCLEWLRDRGNGEQRTEVLFFEEGTINANFNVPVVEPPFPPPGPWINQLIQGIEEENLFNKAILERVRLGQLLRAVLVVLTAGLLLYGLYRLVKARHRVDSAAQPLAQAVNRQLSLHAVLHQRHQDMLRADNLWEAGRTLAQQCFEPVPGAREGAPLPRIRTAGGWWQRRRLHRLARRLWQLAFGAAPVRVSAHEFLDLVREMEVVKAALAKGTLVIGT